MNDIISTILTEYGSLFSFKNKYFQHFRKPMKFLIIMLVIIGNVLTIVLIFKMKSSFSLIGLLFAAFAMIPNKLEINRVIKQHYNLKNKKEVSALYQQILQDRLLGHKISVDDTDQVDYLINLLDQRIEEDKPSLYIKSGIIAGVIGPIWISFIGYYYENCTNFKDAYMFLFYSVIIFILFYFFYIEIKIGYIDTFFLEDYNRMKKFRSLLQGYRLINTKKN